MKKKEILDDLEIYVDPKPLTKDEELALSLFIRQLKNKKAQRPRASKPLLANFKSR
jgi:hypothetical protein